MRITNATNPTPAASIDNPTAQAPRTEGVASGVPASSLPAQTSSLVPSFDLLTLHAALRQLPAIRSDAVAETVRRLASGQLRTPDALAQTAGAILEA
jgi:hypothetical protein